MTRGPAIVALFAVLGAVRAATAGVWNVPADAPTIQAAVDRAAPGDTIRVAAGEYVESVRIKGAKAGLTIESADPAAPFTIRGTPNKSNDGVRVDKVDRITLRGFRIVGAYDGVRLNDATHALVLGLQIENSALGIRVNGGRDNGVAGCTVSLTRVEEGIFADGSPGVVLLSNLVEDTARLGIRVLDSDGAILSSNVVRNAGSSDGIFVSQSIGARVSDCEVTGSYRDGVRIQRATGLVLERNTSNANGSAGFRIDRCWPFQSSADVLAGGNTAAGNGAANVIVIAAGPCSGAGCPVTTTTSTVRPTTTTRTTTTRPATTTGPVATTSTSTTAATPTTQPGDLVLARWRLYVRIANASGQTNVNLPKRAVDPPAEIAIRVQAFPAFAPNDRMTAAEIAALGDDTTARLMAGAGAYAAAHPADFPGFTSVVGLIWAERVP